MERLDNLLSRSAQEIQRVAETHANAPLDREAEREVGHQQEALSKLLTTLTGTKVALQKELTGTRAVQVDEQSIQNINKAIALLRKSESTDSRINAIQMMLFGTNVPLWNVLKDIQQLLYTLKTLKKSRGEGVAAIEGMDESKHV